MADLIIYLPSHGYSESDYITASWLDGAYYVRGVQSNSFKISTDDSDDNIVQFTETITDGYVRQQTVGGTTTITGLDHLEGETVFVTNNGESLGSYVVSSGSVTLLGEVLTYQVGLPYACKIKTMRLEVPSAPTTQSKIKRINETVVRHVRSKNGKAGQEYDGVEYLDDLECTFSTQAQDATVLTKGGFSEDGYTTVTSTDPYPFTCLATIVSFTVDENR